LLALALVVPSLAAACGSNEPAKTASGSSDQSHMPAPLFAVALDGVPDEPDWRTAANAVARGWAEAFNKQDVARTTISPLKTPDGAMAKYLLRAKATKADGSLVFDGVALIGGNLMINGSGAPRLEAHLRSIGFPKTRIPAALLIEMVYLSATVKGPWFKQPSANHWDLGGALLSVDDTGATLTLRKSTSAQVTVQFDASAKISIQE
jgi:hypothetical protein